MQMDYYSIIKFVQALHFLNSLLLVTDHPVTLLIRSSRANESYLNLYLYLVDLFERFSHEISLKGSVMKYLIINRNNFSKAQRFLT